MVNAKWVNKIDGLVKEGNLKTALQELENIFKLKPFNRIALKKKAEIYYMQNNLQESLETYEDLISYYKSKEEPLRQFELLKNIGKIYGLLNNSNKAIENYNNALEKFNSLEKERQKEFLEEKIFLLYDLAAFYSKLNQYTEALKFYEDLFQLHSKYGALEGIADDLFEIASIHYKKKDYDKSLLNYYESLKIYNELKLPGQEGIVHYYIGKILHLQENANEAFKHLDKALMIFTKISLEMPFEVVEENEYYLKAKTLWDDIKNKRNI